MRDWKELALDDTLNEMDNVVPKEEKNLNTVQSQCTPQPVCKEIPFCCATTIPGGFYIPGTESISPQSKPKVSVAWKPCLKLRLERDCICVTACSGQNCGTIPACVTKLSGCIQFIASTEVKPGKTSSQPSTSGANNISNICCKGCVCVDECVGCKLLQRSEACPENLGNYEIKVENESVCVETCEPCHGTSSDPNSKIVKFCGNFIIKYTAPQKPQKPIPPGSTPTSSIESIN